MGSEVQMRGSKAVKNFRQLMKVNALARKFNQKLTSEHLIYNRIKPTATLKIIKYLIFNQTEIENFQFIAIR